MRRASGTQAAVPLAAVVIGMTVKPPAGQRHWN
jgi:hypothetical protein